MQNTIKLNLKTQRHQQAEKGNSSFSQITKLLFLDSLLTETQ